MYKQAQNEFDTLSTFDTLDEALRRIALVEQQVRNLSRSLQAFYVQGRLRTDRTVPANSADVQAQDLLYDRVLSPSLEYILINNSGTLAWRTITLSSF
jgi:hypothetical protein